MLSALQSSKVARGVYVLNGSSAAFELEAREVRQPRFNDAVRFQLKNLSVNDPPLSITRGVPRGEKHYSD
jgi:hypothetical protein